MRGTQITSLFFIIVLIASPSLAGLNQWTSHGPEGAAVTALVHDPDDARFVYAGTEGGGVLRTNAGDVRWEAMGSGLSDPNITALAFDSGVPRALHAGTSTGRVFRSNDHGESWTELARPSSGAIRGFGFSRRGTTIYLATDTGLMLSRDDGASWQAPFKLAAGIRTVAVSSEGDVYVLMKPPSEIYVSADDGVSWNLATSGWATLMVTDPETSAIYAAANTVVVRSTDRLKTWQNLPRLQGSVTALLVVNRDLYVATRDGVYVLTEEATNWIRAGTLHESATALAIVDSSPRDIYAGTRSTIVAALDGSSNFVAASDGLNGAFVTDVALAADDSAYAATPAGVYHSTDGSGVWNKLSEGPAPVTHVETNGDDVYADSGPGIERSNDGGRTWKTSTPRQPAALAVNKAGTLYAAFHEALSSSTDGGQTWRTLMSGFEDPDYFFYYSYSATVLESDPEDSDSMYAAFHNFSRGILFKTVNGGETWRRINSMQPRAGFRSAAARAAVIHAGLKNGMITSIDGGQTWSAVRLADEEVAAITIDPIDTARVYAGTATGAVYRSDDFGETWALFSDGLSGASIHRLQMSESGHRMYAATATGVFEYEFGPAAPFERLPADPARLPRLLRGIATRLNSRDAITSGIEAAAGGSSPAVVLPAVGTVQGAAGMLFRTDVTLSNNRSVEQDVLLAWLPQGNVRGADVATFRVTLAPMSGDAGGTLTIADVAVPLRLEGLGSMIVIAINAEGDVDSAGDVDGFARVRSPSECAAGQVSQSLPGVKSEAFAPGLRARALGLRHDSAYRTNAGIVNLSETTRNFIVVADGQRHSERFSFSVPPYSSLLTAVPAGSYGALALTITAGGEPGPWTAYGSSVDNASGDAWSSVATVTSDGSNR